MRRKTSSVLVAIPVYNEKSYLHSVLGEILHYAEDVLVIDDGSTDGTSEILGTIRKIKILTHAHNLGYGQSMIDAFGYAADHKYEWILTMDCDHQHEPSFIPRFHEVITEDCEDIISGSRYIDVMNHGSMLPPPARLAINRKMTEMINQVLGLKLTDSFCGFKAYRTQKMIDLKLTESGYGFPIQLWIKAARAGLRIREIPVPLIYHDPKRNFGGILEDPKVRWAYYMNILKRELSSNADQIAKNICCSS